MGTNAIDGQSHNSSLCIASETTYGATDTTIASSDSVRIKSGFGYDFTRETADNMVVSTRRSRQGSIDGKKTGGCSFSTPIYMPGGTNTLETSLLWRSLGFSETVGGSSVTYAPAAVSTTLPSLCLLHNVQEVEGKKYTGAAVNQLTISLPDGEAPTYQWELLAKDEINVPRAIANGTVDGSSVAVGAITTNPTADAAGFQVGGLVTVGTSTGHRVTALNYGAGTFNITPNITTNEGSAPAIIPYTPYDDSSLTGTEASSVVGSVSFNGTSICIRSAQIVIAAGLEGIPCWGQETVDGFTNGKLNITGQLELTGTAALIRKALYGVRYGPANREYDIVFTVGDSSTTGAFYHTYTLKAELSYPERSLPDEGVEEVTMNFVAKDSSGNDSLILVSQTA